MSLRDQLTELRDHSARSLELATKALAELPPLVTTVTAGQSLQAALDQGGAIEYDGIFGGNYRVHKAGTRLVGKPGSAIIGLVGAPAVFIPPGSKDIHATLPEVRTAGSHGVVQVGTCDSRQTRVEDVPAGIVLSVTIPTYRGKHAIEFHATESKLLHTQVWDAYDPAGQDSQALWICNTPGNIEVYDFRGQAGSEIILVGGDVVKIPGVNPNGLDFEQIVLDRPLSWRTDGVNRKVKNAFELKAGTDVTLRSFTIDGNWLGGGQNGYAIVITPKNGCQIRDVLIEAGELRNVGGVLNLSGTDDNGYIPATQGITFRRVKADVQRPLGTGQFAQWGGEPLDLTFEDCDFTGDTSTIFTTYGSYAWDKDWTVDPLIAPPVRRSNAYVTRGVKLVNNRFQATNGYGLKLQGPTGSVAYGANWKESWPDAEIHGNTFSGAKALALKRNLPADNTFQE